MNSDRNPRGGKPVDPKEAREHGNDPDAVRVEEDSDRSGAGGARARGADKAASDRAPEQEQQPSGKSSSRESSREGREDLASSNSVQESEEFERERIKDLDLKTEPKQDAGHWRARGPLTDIYARGSHGARLHDGKERDNDEGRDTYRETQTGENAAADQSAGPRNQGESTSNTDRGTSLPSVVFGWLTSLGAFPILLAIIGAIVGGLVAALGLSPIGGVIASSVGFLITLFLAFLIGGYVAGRLASRQGVKHGLLVPLLAFTLVALLTVAGGVLGSTFSDALGGAVPSGFMQNVPTSIPQGLGIAAIISGILTLLVPFLGGILGGLWGAKTGAQRP